jgi:hypothetical protein
MGNYGTNGPISSNEMIDFLSSYMHYSADQVALAMGRDTGVLANNMRQMSKVLSDSDIKFSADMDSCMSKLSPTERIEVEERLRQISSIEQEAK